MQWAAASDITTLDEMDLDIAGDLQAIEGHSEIYNTPPDFTVPVSNISPMSAFNPDSELHDIIVSGSYRLGVSESNYTTYQGTEKYNVSPVGSSGEVYVFQQDFRSGSPSPDSVYAYISDGLTVDVLTDCTYSADEYESMTINGSLTGYLVYGAKSGTANEISFYTPNFYAETVQLLVNGSPYGDAIEWGALLKTITYSIDLTETGTISQIGFRFTYSGNHGVTATYQNSINAYFGFRYSDDSLIIEETQSTGGLLSSIIEFLQSILNGILSLPANIASAIGNVLQSLFVPSQDFLTMIQQEFEVLLSERLGFLYTAGTMITDFAGDMLTAINGTATYAFEFPGIGFETDLVDSGEIEILPESEVDLSENSFVTTIQPFLGTAVAFICVVAFVNSAHDMVVALIGGRSYFDYLFRRREG